MGQHIDPGLSWDDPPCLKKLWKGIIVLKGVHGHMDAQREVKEGIGGIVFSDHRGRSLDASPPAILILLELQRCSPEVFDHLEVYVDGGIRRGTDVLKALCLGATAVSIGRPFLYALNYGQDGVEHLSTVSLSYSQAIGLPVHQRVP